MAANEELKIRLNVYTCAKRNNPTANQISAVLSSVGFGIHHSGLEVGDWGELTYNKEGIVRGPSKYVPGWEFYRSEELGSYYGNTGDVDRILKWLRDKAGYRRGAYDLLRRNCNHFTQALTAVLVGSARFPSYVNRPAELASSTFGLSGSMLLDEAKNNPDADLFLNDDDDDDEDSFYFSAQESSTLLPTRWQPNDDTSVVIVLPSGWIASSSDSADSSADYDDDQHLLDDDDLLPPLANSSAPYRYLSPPRKDESTAGWTRRIEHTMEGDLSDREASCHNNKPSLNDRNNEPGQQQSSVSLLQAARDTAAAHRLPKKALMTKQLESNAALLCTPPFPLQKIQEISTRAHDDSETDNEEHFLVSAEPPPPPRHLVNNSLSPESLFGFLVCGFCQVEAQPTRKNMPLHAFRLEQALAAEAIDPDYLALLKHNQASLNDHRLLIEDDLLEDIPLVHATEDKEHSLPPLTSITGGEDNTYYDGSTTSLLSTSSASSKSSHNNNDLSTEEEQQDF